MLHRALVFVAAAVTLLATLSCAAVPSSSGNLYWNCFENCMGGINSCGNQTLLASCTQVPGMKNAGSVIALCGVGGSFQMTWYVDSVCSTPLFAMGSDDKFCTSNAIANSLLNLGTFSFSCMS